MKYIKEYPKALTVILVAVIVYYIRPLWPDFFSQEIIDSMNFIINGILAVLFGRYIRLSKTEAEYLDNENMYKPE